MSRIKLPTLGEMRGRVLLKGKVKKVKSLTSNRSLSPHRMRYLSRLAKPLSSSLRNLGSSSNLDDGAQTDEGLNDSDQVRTPSRMCVRRK